MKLVVLIFAVGLLGCSSPVRKTKQVALPLPGGGHKMLTVRDSEPVFRPAAARLVIIPWRYNVATPSNWWWNLEHSFDMRNWSVMASNVTGSPTVFATNRQGFFRLAGRP